MSLTTSNGKYHNCTQRTNGTKVNPSKLWNLRTSRRSRNGCCLCGRTASANQCRTVRIIAVSALASTSLTSDSTTFGNPFSGSVEVTVNDEKITVPEKFIYTKRLVERNLLVRQTIESLQGVSEFIEFTFDGVFRHKSVTFRYVTHASEFEGLELRVARKDLDKFWDELYADESIPYVWPYTSELREHLQLYDLDRDEKLMNRGEIRKDTRFYLVGFSNGYKSKRDTVSNESSIYGSGDHDVHEYPVCGFIYRSDDSSATIVVESEKMRNFINDLASFESGDDIENDTITNNDAKSGMRFRDYQIHNEGAPSKIVFEEELAHLLEPITLDENSNVLEDVSVTKLDIDIYEGVEFKLSRFFSDDGGGYYIYESIDTSHDELTDGVPFRKENLVNSTKEVLNLRVKSTAIEELFCAVNGTLHKTNDVLSEDEISKTVINALGILGGRKEKAVVEVEEVQEDEKQSSPLKSNLGSWPVSKSSQLKQQDVFKHEGMLKKQREEERDKIEKLNDHLNTNLVDFATKEQKLNRLLPNNRVEYGPAVPPGRTKKRFLDPLVPNGPSPLPTETFVVEDNVYDSKDFVMFEIDATSTSFILKRYEDGKMSLRESFVYDNETREYSQIEFNEESDYEKIPSDARHYQYIFSQQLIPMTFKAIDGDLDRDVVDRNQYLIDAVYLIPKIMDPSMPEQMKLNLEEVYVLNGETKKIERGLVEGEGGKQPVLVVREGKLHLEDANKQKTPLELYKEYLDRLEEERLIKIEDEKYMFLNREVADFDDGGDDLGESGNDSFKESDEILELLEDTENALKDIEEGPDVPDSDLN